MRLFVSGPRLCAGPISWNLQGRLRAEPLSLRIRGAETELGHPPPCLLPVTITYSTSRAARTGTGRTIQPLGPAARVVGWPAGLQSMCMISWPGPFRPGSSDGPELCGSICCTPGRSLLETSWLAWPAVAEPDASAATGCSIRLETRWKTRSSRIRATRPRHKTPLLSRQVQDRRPPPLEEQLAVLATPFIAIQNV